MIALFLFAFAMVLSFVAGVAIFTALKPKEGEPPPDPNRAPGALKSSLLKMQDAFREDEDNPTYCVKCKKHMLRLYYENDKPSNQYQCPSCRKTITLIAR